MKDKVFLFVDKYLLSFIYKENEGKCPKCSSSNISKMVWGYPIDQIDRDDLFDIYPLPSLISKSKKKKVEKNIDKPTKSNTSKTDGMSIEYGGCIIDENTYSYSCNACSNKFSSFGIIRYKNLLFVLLVFIFISMLWMRYK